MKDHFQILYHIKSQEKRDIIKTLLVAGSDLKKHEENVLFWETVVAIAYNAIERLRRVVLTVAKRKGRIFPPF